ncbi:MAG: PilX N-terminal domain-containing pilus assembly protein, partial [Desulfofundulus sp.]
MNALKNGGQVALLVAVVAAVLLLLGVSAITLASTGMRSTYQQRDQVQAFYVAETRVERLLAKIRRDQTWFEGLSSGSKQIIFSQQSFAGGTIEEVTLQKIDAGAQTPGTGTEVEIISRGKFGVARKTLKVDLIISSVRGLLKGFNILPDSPVNLNVTGDFHLEGNNGAVVLN